MKNLLKYIIVGTVASVIAVCGISIVIKFRQISEQKKQLSKNLIVLKNDALSAVRDIEETVINAAKNSKKSKSALDSIKTSIGELREEFKKSGNISSFRIWSKYPVYLTKEYLINADFRNAVNALNKFKKSIMS